MKIEFVRPDGTSFEASPPFIGADLVEVRNERCRCPVCFDKHAVVDAGGTIRALAGSMSLDRALRDVEDRFGSSRAIPPNPTDLLRLRGRTTERSDRHEAGVAECARCRSEVGRLVTTYDTIFGIEEDTRVLAGRCRVY